MLADDEVQLGIIGHAVAFVRRTSDLDDAAARIPAPAHVARHVREQEIVQGRDARSVPSVKSKPVPT